MEMTSWTSQDFDYVIAIVVVVVVITAAAATIIITTSISFTFSPLYKKKVSHFTLLTPEISQSDDGW